MPRDVGLSTCIVCEAQVMVRENANGAAYYKCNGHVDENRRACGADVKFGLRDSRVLIEKLEAESKNAIHEKPAREGKRPEPRDPAGSENADGAIDPERTETGKRKREAFFGW